MNGNHSLLIALLIGLVSTSGVVHLVLENERGQALIAFEEQAAPMVLAVEEAILADTEVVYSIAGFYAGSTSVDREEFAAFVARPLSRFPNIQALEWVPRVSRQLRTEYETAAREEGLHDYVIREMRDGALVPAGEREEYFPVLFAEPLEPNRKALGFDLASDPERLAALVQARDSGQPVITSRITLVQEQGSQAGVLLFLPIYENGAVIDTLQQRRDGLQGFALGVLRLGDLVHDSMALTGGAPDGVSLMLFDRSAPQGQQLLHAYDVAEGTQSVEAELDPEQALRGVHFSHEFELGDRRWMLVIRQTGQDLVVYAAPAPWIVLFIGVMLTVLMVGYLRSLTDRNREVERRVAEQTSEIKDKEAYNRAIYETVVDGIITIDPSGFIRSCNPATGGMFGYESASLVGQKINMLMPSHYAQAHDGYLERYMATGEAHVIGIGREVEGQRSDGSTFPLELAVSRMEVAGETLFTGVVRDITERKRIDQMKAEFISTVSHELRTPLTSICGAMGLVAGGAVGELPEQAKKLVKIAASNSERLVRLINDILDIEKIEAGQMHFDRKRQPLLPVIERALEENRSYAAEHGSRYQLLASDGDVELDIDADRIRQVLDNLLSNAAKYGAEEDQVEVCVIQGAREIRVEVRDHGPGIPEEFQSRIFGKFAQADSSDTRQKGGTGLGLSIAKAIVEQHGGRLWFETELGQGTSFIMQLPLSESKVDPVLSVVTSNRALICEDDVDVGKRLVLLLERAGIQADLALNAPQALAMLEQNDYQVMTLGLTLPEGDCISLLKELRRSERHRGLPVVVVAAKGAQEIEVSSALRVSDWLSKPIEEGRLVASVTQAMQQRGDGGPARVLHVEDDCDIATVIGGVLQDLAAIDVAPDLATAQIRLDADRYDLVVLDVGLPDGSGLDLLPRIAEFVPALPVVIFSAQEVDTETAAQVSSVLTKSRTDNEQLIQVIKGLLDLADHSLEHTDKNTNS